MKHIDKFLLGSYGLFYIAVGIMVALLEGNYLTQEKLNKLLSYVYLSSNDNMFWAAIGSVISLTGISILSMLFLSNEDKKSVVFKTEKGEVKITLSAIEDYIRKTIIKMREIKDIRSKIKVRAKGINIKVKLILRSDVGITNIVGKVQDEIETNIKSMLGLDLKIHVDVNVVKMSASKDVVLAVKQEQHNIKSEDDIEDAFHGIQY